MRWCCAASTSRAFLDQGFEIFVDYHQDLYSRYLFHPRSRYTGDGAPRWVVAEGRYPKESCGICVHWGQNITRNAAVRDATHDFWHNRQGVQDAFLDQAQGALAYVKDHLGTAEFAHVIGFDPWNEPHAGRYDAGQTSQSWEREVLWPFYLRFRERMDAAGWPDKPAFVEPGMFWNANLGFQREPGGLGDVGPIGPRFVFNAHFYDQKAMSGVFMWGKARDGRYVNDFNTIRQRAADLGTVAVVSEFGGPVSGLTAGKTPTVLKAMYQAMDSRVAGGRWWAQAARSGPVLSGTQWQWDTYSDRHHELMNGNPDKPRTAGDAWNGEDLSMVEVDDAGNPRLRQDVRLLDRMYPAAVAGRTVAFAYEDRARDGAATLTWNPVPSWLPHVRGLVGDGQYGLLAWRCGPRPGGRPGRSGDAPTELRLPGTFTAERTTVVSDLGAVTGPPPYTSRGRVADHAVAVAARRLLLTAPGTPGSLHYALVTNAPAPSAEARTAAQRELAGWAAATPFPD